MLILPPVVWVDELNRPAGATYVIFTTDVGDPQTLSHRSIPTVFLPRRGSHTAFRWRIICVVQIYIHMLRTHLAVPHAFTCLM